ncbi:MAG TPA: ATP-binding cassette domain-containing protein [Methanophagales archaeon]|nr:ATP-binding cassette domain-containing protein [Methanophagales archaeon]
MVEHVIQITNLTKEYGKLKAVDNVSLNIGRGEIFGLLGPNGAGKTTTINILVGLSLPTSGTAKIAGLDVTKHPIGIRKRLGIAAQDAYFDHHLSIKDNLFYHGLLYGLPRKELKKRVDAALQWSKLEKYRDKNFHHLSGGMQRRLVVARAMLSDPEILLLDEPTTGLDPQTRRQVWGYIKNLKEVGKTVLLTTHYMEEADILCDRIAIIDHGRIIARGTPNELKKMLDKNITIEITVNPEVMNNHIEKDLNAMSGVIYVEMKSNRIRIGVDDDAIVEQVLRNLITKTKISEINIIRPTLDDVFLHLTGREIR